MFLFAPSHGVGRMPLWGFADSDASVGNGDYEDNRSAEELFQVTKAEFRRLTRQREQLAARPPPPPPPAATDAALSRWFRPEPHADTAEKIAGYRAELEASARAFCDRKKWAPLLLHHSAAAASLPTQPRPHPVSAVDDDSVPPRPLSSGRRPTPPVRPATAAPTSRRSERTDAKRPLSAIANSRFADDVTYGAYDTLTPDVLRALSIRCDEGRSDRWERSLDGAATSADGCGDASSPRLLRPSSHALWTVDPLLKTTTTIATECAAKGPCDPCRRGGDDAGSSGPSIRRAATIEHLRTSGRAEMPAPLPTAIGSQAGVGWRTAARVKESEAMAHAGESEEDDEEQEAEKGYIRAPAAAAAARDRSRYDFEAGATPQPDYPFKDALSPALMAVDFASVAAARIGAGDDDEKAAAAFDSIAIGDGAERKIAARLLQLARLQLATRREEDESRRRMPTADTTEFARWPSRLRPRMMAAATAAASATRRRAAPGARACCADCLQPACVGDCPEKKPLLPRAAEADSGRGCPLCRRRSCAIGGCSAAEAAAPYEAHERRPEAVAQATEVDRRDAAACAASGGVRRAASMRPRSCGPRLTRQTTAAAATYSATEAADAARLPTTPVAPLSSRPPTAVGGRDGGRGAPPGSLAPTPTAVRCRSARLRGRNSVLPGKSFFSQRRRSLTGGGSGGCIAAARNAARSADRERRARSAKS